MSRDVWTPLTRRGEVPTKAQSKFFVYRTADSQPFIDRTFLAAFLGREPENLPKTKKSKQHNAATPSWFKSRSPSKSSQVRLSKY